jgi:plasmid stabilization system protein ParE
MAKKVIWSKKAESIFIEILQFYVKRNGSNLYSRKINTDIKRILSLLCKYPLLGKTTDVENVRVFIVRNYKIFYRIKPSEIIVLMVWDCRRNPAEFAL